MGATCSSQRTDKVAPAPSSILPPKSIIEKEAASSGASDPVISAPRPSTRPQLPPVDTLSARALVIPQAQTTSPAGRRRNSASGDGQLPPRLATVLKGVSLRGLRKVRTAIRKHFGDERYGSVSTTEVCHQWVKVVTAPAGKCRLVELPGLLDAAEGDVGRPMYFISHAWSNSIELLFRKVFDFLASADDGTRVWLDVLAVCQHESNPAHKADIAAFPDVVKACSGGTLVVMDLTRCNPSTRAWCVFEWAHTLAAHGPDGLHMSLAPLERAVVFGDLDVERAECFRPADKEMIMREVRRQHGSPEAFNAKLKLQLLLEPLSYTVDLRRLQERSRDTGWDFGEVERWLDGDRTGRALCVVSGAGEGKSTISAELVRRLTPAGLGPATPGSLVGGAGLGPRGHVTCAYHFLKYNDQRRLEPVRIIKTLAFQLASRLPSVCSALLALDVAEVAQLTDVDRAFELLLLKPMLGVTNPVVVILDALDEADPLPFATSASASAAAAEQLQLPTSPTVAASPPPPPPTGGGSGARYPVLCGNRALQLLTKHLQRLSPAVRFFVTTRPDAASGQVVPALERTFHRQGGSSYLKPSQLVRSFALRASGGDPSAIPATPSGGGGGVMVYHTVVKACLADGKGEEDPEGDSAAGTPTGDAAATAFRTPDGGKSARGPLLSSLLGGMSSPSAKSGLATPGGGGAAADLTALYRVYGKVFRKAYEWYDLRKRTDVSKLLNVLMAAQEPLPQSLVQQLGLGHAVSLLPGFPVLFYVDEHHLFTIHKSLADWLLLDAHAGGAGGSGAERNPSPSRPLDSRQASDKSLVSSVAGPASTGGGRSLFGRLHGGSAAAATATTTASGGGGGGGGGGLFLMSRGPPAQASRATQESEAAAAAQLQAAAVAAANAPHPSFDMDVAQGHLLMGRYLSTTRNASPSTYCLKYLVTHLAAAGPAAAELLDDVLSSFGFIEAVFARGFAANMIRALGTMGHSTRISRDALRWLRAKQHDLLLSASAAASALGSGPGSGPPSGEAVVGTALMSPIGSELYRVALRAAGQGWRTRVARPPYDEWPADQAVLKGHAGNITAVLFSRDGRQLVSSSGGGNELRVWDISSGTCTAVLLGHEADVTCLAMSDDGHVLASGSNDMTCRLWDAATGQCTAVLRGHTAPVTGVSFSPPERGKPPRLVTASSDNALRIWSPMPRSPAAAAAARGRKQSSGGAAVPSPLNPHGRGDVRQSSSAVDLDFMMGLTTRASGGEPFGAPGGGGGGGGGAHDEGVCSHACVQVLQGREGGLQGVAWAPDGKRLAGAHGAEVCVWGLPAGKVTATLSGHSANVLAVAFSPNDGGRRLASCGWDKVVRVWDTRTNKCVAIATGHSDLVRSICWAPDGRRLASASSDNTLRIWDAAPTLSGGAAGTAAPAVAVQCTALLRQGEWMTAVCFSPDGRSMASGSVAKELRLWDVAACEAEFAAACAAAREALVPPPAAPSPAEAAAAMRSTPSTRLKAAAVTAAGTLDKMTQKSMKLFTAAEAEAAAAAAATAAAAAVTSVAHTGDVTCVALSPDGAILATASQDKTVRLYDSASARWMATLSGHDGCVTCVAWAPPATTATAPPQLASVSHDLTVRIWDLQLGSVVQATCTKTLLGHTDRIRSVAWSPAADGRLATGAEDNHVRLWETRTSPSGSCTATMWGHGNYVTCVCYCPADGGRTVTSASQDGTVRVWDTGKGQVLRVLQGHDHYVNHVSYTPSGAHLASAACDQSIKVWDHATGKCLTTLTGHTHFVNCVAFEPPPDGGGGGGVMPRRLASASTDATIRVWELKTRKCVAVLEGHAGPVHCVTWIKYGGVGASPAAAAAPPPPPASKGRRRSSSSGGPMLELASGSADHSVRLWCEGYGAEG